MHIRPKVFEVEREDVGGAAERDEEQEGVHRVGADIQDDVEDILGEAGEEGEGGEG